MSDYRRHFVPGGSWFFTVTLADRRQDLLTRHIDLLRGVIRQVRLRHPFLINAMVVLPEHLHALWTLPPGDADYPLRWRQIKAGFSRGLPVFEARSPSRLSKAERGIWQRRYWEHAIRDAVDFERHVNYIHFNPVNHGYAKCVKDWPYSSFHRYVGRGLLPVDWGGGYEEDGLGEKGRWGE